ncbi:hypothetical protein EYF80_020833 [Liparis tanakae]|uniref:Uncharacterized protein n=1 Tax=Liparis tanakae TaxID=230148 RepID=A0A4Z2HVP1_9TELE|nr:hypothetical protein EYF80_020833 [Liparis tanakae]
MSEKEEDIGGRRLRNRKTWEEEWDHLSTELTSVTSESGTENRDRVSRVLLDQDPQTPCRVGFPQRVLVSITDQDPGQRRARCIINSEAKNELFLRC